MTAAAITGIFRKAAFCLLGTIVPVLAFASVIEKITGSAIVSDCLYASPLFFSLWTVTMLTVIITYFGVNFILVGAHSYA